MPKKAWAILWKRFVLFTGLHLTVKEVYFQRNIDVKSDLSLVDFKKQNKLIKFYKKKSSQIEFELFFDVEPPYETRNSLF